eukprot:CAMPEP_0178391508 /NCGR_PEP_ID=MMETSP0689_2-20121128/11201_1 /TAXON_ID=160604 /ORGANISM="Amphidinium massartii, Strain CS-259" /LENGTH=36 /DNA_ID= /DNA_START= /DNA_END= /DNA_ORIENTATION=
MQQCAQQSLRLSLNGLPQHLKLLAAHIHNDCVIALP